jgi:vacuolar-type H+-ATPase subunit E/Vma4
MKSLQSLEYANKTLEAYIGCWIFEKSDEEMWAITQTLESYYDKALLKEFYWDYSLELQNMKDGERYVWLLQEMKNILALAKDDDLTRAYSKKLEEEYFEWIKDSELFD